MKKRPTYDLEPDNLQKPFNQISKQKSKVCFGSVYHLPLSISILSVLGGIQIACAHPNQANGYSYQEYADASQDNYVGYLQKAQSAYQRKDAAALAQYESIMQGSLFAMYPTYWRLYNQLSQQNPATISYFVRQYPDSVLAEKLVADYAEVKAKQNDYAAVRQVADLIQNADASERCAIALGFNKEGDSIRAISEKPNVWLTTKKQNSLCTQLAKELNSNPLITQGERVARLKRVIRKNLTEDIVSLSGQLGSPISYTELANIRNNPTAFLSQFNQYPMSANSQYLYLYAIARLADQSYQQAAYQLNQHIIQDSNKTYPILTDDTRRYAYRILGVKRMNHNTDHGFNIEAVHWFRNSVDDDFNFEEAEDYAQAAIRFSQWQDLITAISRMDIVTQKENMWQYWLARAYEQVGNAQQKQQARSIYQKLAQNYDYYGLLAKDKLGQKLNIAQLGNQMPTVSQADKVRLQQNPHFARAFALYQSNMGREYANREWNWAVKRARDQRDNALIVAAAQRAHDLDWYDRAIYAIDNSPIDNLAIAYPSPYLSSVRQYGRQYGIDPAWVYGIVRQESRFSTTARSGAQAGGLMQIIPDTAKMIARNLGERYDASRINHGDTNIRYGTWYLNYLSNKTKQPVVATASYNAGFKPATKWKPVNGSLAADQYIDTIPYPETQDYVKKVMANATIYGYLLGNPKSISQRMGVVYPN